MKQFRRITAFILVLVMLAGSACFASNASIVSPLSGTVVVGDNYLLSVKMTGQTKVDITVYEEREFNAEGISTSAITAYFTDVASMEGLKTEYISGAALTTLNVMLKDDNGTSISAVAKTYIEKVNQETVSYTNSGEMGFYTKQLSAVTPGLYRIEILTLDAAGNAVEVSNSFVAVKAKDEGMEKSNVFETEQGGAVQFLQNLLKSLFQKNN